MRLPGPLTIRAFSSLPRSSSLFEAGGAGGTSMLQSLEAQDRALQQLYEGAWPPRSPRQFVRSMTESARTGARDLEVDVAVCGGTLGLLLACTLQLKGHRVVVLEAGPLRGRAQDWNTSEEELQTLITMGCLTQDELQLVAPLSFGPMSCRFGPSPTFDLQLQGVLDVAVSPTALLECVRRRFEAAGGLVLERTLVTEVRIYADGAELALEGPDEGGASRILHSRLVVDCMGHRSPIALQQRDGQRPDGVCVQVGSCVRGAWAMQRRAGDFFVTHTDAQRAGPQCNARVQYFWQAFPSSGGADERSTYLFAYLRPGLEMPTLLEAMETYWEALPVYQGLEGVDDEAARAQLDDVRRILFGWFPTYKANAPLAPRFDRIISVGDASAVQSPISFGGFCAMLRHLPRYTRGLDLALRQHRLRKDDLAWISPYLPNLGTAWMSAAAMTARALPPPPLTMLPSTSPATTMNAAPALWTQGAPAAAAEPPYTLVNDLLAGNFRVMATLPRPAALVFFRDVTTLPTLLAILGGQTASMAPLLPRVVAELVGPVELLGFAAHLVMLTLYTVVHQLSVQLDLLLGRASDSDTSQPLEPRAGRAPPDFRLVCLRDALAYGSGLERETPRVSEGARSSDDAPLASTEAAPPIEPASAPKDSARPWWQRPPRVWPPRIDDFQLVIGDVLAAYTSAYLCLDVLTTGRESEWTLEGSAIACAWLVGAAVTNAWDPTAVLPSLGLSNALACVARASVDFASTRVFLALVVAVLAADAVDIKLLGLELALNTVAVALWRSLYTTANRDRR